MQERLRVVPGVDPVSFARHTPSFSWGATPVRIPGAAQPVTAEINDVGPDYLRTLGLSPVAGRELAPGDRAGREVAAVINQHLAEALWPGESPLGRTLLGRRGAAPRDVLAVLGAASLAACSVPAYRVARVDAMVALRQE